jgi:hypothetical protein
MSQIAYLSSPGLASRMLFSGPGEQVRSPPASEDAPMQYDDPHVNEVVREVYNLTNVVRKPISGIVSGYHVLPYLLVAPDTKNTAHALQVTGRINVSPRLVISPTQLNEAFGDVFDPSTFDGDLHARLFSFAVGRRRNMRVNSEHFEIRSFEEGSQERLQRLEDELAREENTRTALIYGPRFDYYPVSVDRFVNEVLEREFRL